MTKMLSLAAFCLVLVGAARPSAAQSSSLLPGVLPAAKEEVAAELQSPAEKRKELAGRLTRVEQAIKAIQSSEPSGEVPGHLVSQRDLITYLELIYAQQETAAELKTDLAERRSRLNEELEMLRQTGPVETPPYSFLLLDHLRDQLSAELARGRSLEMEIKATRALLQSMQQTYGQHESHRRTAREAVETNDNPDQKTRLAQEFELAELRSLVAAEAVRLRKMDLVNNEAAGEINQIRTTYLNEKTAIVAKKVTFSKADLDSRLRDISRYEQDRKQNLKKVQERLVVLEKKWFEAKQCLERDPAHKRELTEAVSAWQRARESHQKRLALINQQLGNLVVVRAVWELRYRIANRLATAKEMQARRADIDGFIERTEQAKQLLEIRLADQRIDLSTLGKRLATEAQRDPKCAYWINEQVRHLNEMVVVYGTNLVNLEIVRRLLEKTAAELDAQVAPSTAGQWLETAGRTIKASWNYELTSVDDRPITVRKIVSGLVLLLLGMTTSRFLSRVLGRRFLPRLGLDEGVSMALESISFYTLLTMFTFVSLELVHVPLTVFTFLGGAVAIGVGFGSQNVLNNFISGLILLAERPIRVGDMIEIDGVYGTIEHVGARSTRVRTGSNLEIIVPNSKFLENNVTNWTLSDTRSRVMVSVGVAYGSPTREVTRIVDQAVRDNPDVLDTPEPIILFHDFGDNALVFEVHFWVHMRTMMQGRRVQSEVRHTIGERLANAGITIAFPQRDVHLDAAGPIEVQLRPADAARLTQAAPERAA